MNYRETAMKTLASHESSRNDDWSFIFSFLEESGIRISAMAQDEIKKSELNINTMLRERQYIQNKLGQYGPTDPAVVERRKARQKHFSETYKS